MSEHLALVGGERKGGTAPSPTTAEEQRMVSSLLGLYDEARTHRADWDKVWKQSWRFYVGDQWPQLPSWKADPVENYIFSKVETILPILTDNRPTIHVLPREAGYDDYAEHMHNLFSYLWDRLNMDDTVLEATKNCLIFGKGIYYSYWDYEKEEIASVSVDPQNIFIDPLARRITDARYLIHIARMSSWDILNMWPDAEGRFKEGAQMVPEPAQKGVIGTGDKQSVHIGQAYADPSIPVGRTVPWVRAGMQGFGSVEDDTVQVLQFWIRDPAVSTKAMLDRDGKQMTDTAGNELFVEKRAYPGGRHIVLAGDRVIHDGPNPFDHQQFPYVEQDCHRIPGGFWGISAVQQLIPIQRELNKTLGQLIDNRNLMGNLMWKVGSNSGIKADQIVAKPGLVVVKTPGSEVDTVDVKPLPAYISGLIDHTMLALDRVSGVSDVTEGRKPTGITAGIAIESLQEAGQTRLRALVRNLENAIRNLGTQWVGLAQQFYQEAKTIRVTDPETGQFSFDLVGPEQLRAQWEVEVAAGSTLPRSREVRQGQAVELYQLGIFDAEELLKWIQHPGRDDLLMRLKARDQQQLLLAQQGASLQGSLGQGNAAGPPSPGMKMQPTQGGGLQPMPMGVQANLRSQQR